MHEQLRDVDDDGLEKAYASKDGTYVLGDTMYIAGTRTINDALIRWPQIGTFTTGNTERYQQAVARLKKSPFVTKLVGHSYGAAVADLLTRRSKTYSARLYGAARYGTYHPRITSFRHQGDPVSALDFDSYTDKNIQLNPHSFHGYSWMDR